MLECEGVVVVKHARLTLRYPPNSRHPMQSFIQESDAIEREELWAWNHLGACLTALFYVEGDIDPYRAAIEQVETIERFDLTPVGDDAFYTYVEEERRDEDLAWMQAFARPSLIVVPPVEYTSDGDTLFTVVGSADDLQGLVADLPNDISVDVDRVGEYDEQHSAGTAPALTERQREAVTAALDVGYYDNPRRGSLADVADELDCATGTASELLRRAEYTALSAAVPRRSEPTH